ncbi:hypothetical protein JK211_01150 [Tatumella sp. JGM130]|nr:hypothetical protein [Tatumella sp. JGM130]MBS0892635.1 hypothetical protein [Tatumella sp. JGM130]
MTGLFGLAALAGIRLLAVLRMIWPVSAQTVLLCHFCLLNGFAESLV